MQKRQPEVSGHHTQRTICRKEVGVALGVPGRERLDDAVDLLGLARKPDVHQQLADGDVQRVVDEVELPNVCTQSRRMERS
jgi:hypothetical protein